MRDKHLKRLLGAVALRTRELCSTIIDIHHLEIKT